MSYANSTINSYAQGTNWYQGEQSDGASDAIFPAQATLANGVQYFQQFNLGRGSWLITVTGTITINDGTTAWEPSIFGVFASGGQSLATQSLCGLTTYANGTQLNNTLTLWSNSNTVLTNPFYVGFTPVYAGSTVDPQISIAIEVIKIR
jgi:hypothetical protein